MSRIPLSSQSRKKETKPMTQANGHRRISSNPHTNPASPPYISRLPQASRNSLNLNNLQYPLTSYPSQSGSPEIKSVRPIYNKRASLPPPTNVSPQVHSTFSSLSSSSLNVKGNLRRIPIGTRVYTLVGNYKGTLRYLGPTRFKEGIWAGIELDSIGSGKNNGSIDGVTYFTCPENSGIFIDYRKIAPLVETSNLGPLIENNYEPKDPTSLSQKLCNLENPELSPINKKEPGHTKNLSRTDSLNSSLSNETPIDANGTSSDHTVNNLRSKLTLVQKQNNLLALKLKKRQANLEVVQFIKKEFIEKAREKAQSTQSPTKSGQLNHATLLKSISEKDNKILQLTQKLQKNEIDLDIINKELEGYKLNGPRKPEDAKELENLYSNTLKVDTLEQEIKDLRHQVLEKESLIKDLKEQLETSQNLLTEEQSFNMNENDDGISSELEALKKKYKKEIDEMNDKLNEESVKSASNSKKYSELEVINQKLRDELDQAQKEAIQLKERLRSYQDQIDSLHIQLEKYENDHKMELEKDRQLVKELESENKTLKEQIEELNISLERYKESDESQANESDEDYEDDEESESDEDDSRPDIDALMRENDMLRSQNEVLKDTLERNKSDSLYGFEDSVQLEVPKEDRAQEVADLQNRIRVLEDENQRLIEVSEKTKFDLEKGGKDLDENTKEILMLRNMKEIMQAKEQTLNKQLEGLVSEKDELIDKIDQSELEFQKVYNELEQKKNEVVKLKKEMDFQSERAESYKKALKDAASENQDKEDYYRTILMYEEKYRDLQNENDNLLTRIENKENQIRALELDLEESIKLNEEYEREFNQIIGQEEEHNYEESNHVANESKNIDYDSNIFEMDDSVFCTSCGQRDHDILTCPNEPQSFGNDFNIMEDPASSGLLDELHIPSANRTSSEADSGDFELF